MSQYPSSYQGARSCGNLCGRGSQDGHGGHSAQHRQEMMEIAKAAVYEYAPQIAAAIYNDALQRLIGAMEYDIETIVTVSMEDVGEIFSSSRCRKVISDRITRELKARLDGLEFRI